MIPTEVLHLISEYLIEIPYKLADDIIWSIGILKNPYALELIENYLSTHPITIEEASYLICNKNPRVLSYINLQEFPGLVREVCKHHSREAIDMIRNHPVEMLDWSALSANPFAIELLLQNKERIDWEAIAINPSAYDLIVDGLLTKRVNCWGCLYLLGGVHSERLIHEVRDSFSASMLSSSRTREKGGEIPVIELCSRPDQIEQIKKLDPSIWSIYGLAENPHPETVELIERWLSIYPYDEDVISALCGSRNKKVLEMVEELYSDMVDCGEISLNPEAIDLLLRNREWVRWDFLENNPSERVMEVVRKYIHSFNASTLKIGMYKRREILEVDVKRYKKIIEVSTKKLL